VLLIKVQLEARGLWSAVDPGNAEFQVHRMTLDAICSAVPPEMVTSLAMKDMAMEAWESIKTMCIGDEHVRLVTTLKLRHEYETLTFCEGDGVEDFAMQLAGIVNQLTALGDPELEDKVVLKYLRITRPTYKQLVLSIETLLDVSMLSLEEVTGQLKMTEEDVAEPSVAEGRLLLTEEEWCERSKKEQSGEGSWGGSNGGRGRGPGRAGGRGGCGDGNGLVNVASSSQIRRRRWPIRPKKKSKAYCLLRFTLSRGQLEGNMVAHSSPAVLQRLAVVVGTGPR
jgi:hypothetical protein